MNIELTKRESIVLRDLLLRRQVQIENQMDQEVGTLLHGWDDVFDELEAEFETIKRIVDKL